MPNLINKIEEIFGNLKEVALRGLARIKYRIWITSDLQLSTVGLLKFGWLETYLFFLDMKKLEWSEVEKPVSTKLKSFQPNNLRHCCSVWSPNLQGSGWIHKRNFNVLLLIQFRSFYSPHLLPSFHECKSKSTNYTGTIPSQ